MSKPWRTTLRQLWWAPLVCYGLAALLNQWDGVRQFEWQTLDWRTKYRVQFQPPPDPRLWMVLFDDATEENLVAWPDSRPWHGQLSQLVAVHGAKVLTFDVFITSERDPEADKAMADGMADAAKRGLEIVTGALRSDFPTESSETDDHGPTEPLRHVTGDLSGLVQARHAALPIPVLRQVSHFGFVDVPKYGDERVVSADGIVRQLPMVVRIGERIYPSLSLITLMRYFGLTGAEVEVRIGDAVYLKTRDKVRRIPVDHRGCLLLNYRYEAVDSPSVFPAISYRTLTLGLHSKYVSRSEDAPEVPDLKGAILMLGLFVTGNSDAAPSPLSEFSPLPLVHLNALNNVLAEDYARRVPEAWIWAVAVVLGYIGVLLLADRSVFILCGGAVLGFVAYVSLTVWAWVTASLWFDLVAPINGFGLLQFVVIGRRILDEQRAKQEIKGMFGAYLAPQLVDRLVRAGKPPELGGHEEEITAYFSDIQGYSTFSEKVTPAKLVELLNDYLTVCTDIIQEEGGTLDKYIGDAVVAMFGAPLPLNDHAYRACVSALRVQRALDELRRRWEGEGEAWPLTVRQMRSRIGLNTGRAIVGNMGSRTRFSYTMTGDDVNLAARMESGAKSWGAYTMCTEATKLACEAHGGDRVVFRLLGRIVVKGRTQAVPIYEVTGLKEHVTDRTRECLGVFAAGLERYYARDWDKALALFQQSEALEPLRPGEAPGVASNPSLIYQDIVRHYRAEPPPKDWDGVFVMKEK